MAEWVIHISEEEAASDFASVLARVREGAEVVIEGGGKLPVAVVHSPIPQVRKISESIELAKQHAKEAGGSPILDSDFAADVEEVIRNRKPWNPPSWE